MQRAPERRRHRDEQRVRQVDDIGDRLVPGPVHELVELLAQLAAFPLQHGDRHLAEEPGIGGDAAAGERVDDPRRIPQPIEDARQPADDGRVLLQVHADAAEQHVPAADVLVIGQRRRVDRDQGHVVTPRHQLDGQRIVPEAAAAIHPCGTGCDRQDLHQRPTPKDPSPTACRPQANGADWNARARNRKSTMLPS